MSKPSITILQDTRRKTLSGLYPVYVRASFQVHSEGKKKQKVVLYRILNCSIKDFNNPGSRDINVKDIHSKIIKARAKALDILERHSVVTPGLFDREFKGGDLSKNVKTMFEYYITNLQNEGRVGSARLFVNAKNHILAFGGNDISFSEITEEWLKEYERSSTIALSTLGIYLRSLRAVFNLAIEAKVIPSELYPFGKRRYKIKSVQGTKESLTEDQKNRLLNYTTVDGAKQKALDFFFFSYFNYGINFTDIANLKRKDIRNGFLIYDRQKTRNTENFRKPLSIPIRQEVEKVILKYGNHDLNPDSYIFPILEPGLTPSQKEFRIHAFLKEINGSLKEIGKEIGLSFKLTTYVARHTFATLALRNGAPVEFIRIALGNSNIIQPYLHGYDDETKRSISDKLGLPEVKVKKVKKMR